MASSDCSTRFVTLAGCRQPLHRRRKRLALLLASSRVLRSSASYGRLGVASISPLSCFAVRCSIVQPLVVVPQRAQPMSCWPSVTRSSR